MKYFVTFLLILLIAVVGLPLITLGQTPVTWLGNQDADTLEPLTTFRGAEVRVSSLNATSTTNSSTFVNASTTNLTVSGSLYGGAGGSDTQLQFNNSGDFGGTGILYSSSGSSQILTFPWLTLEQEDLDVSIDITSTSLTFNNFDNALFEFANTSVTGILDFSGIATTDKTFTFQDKTGTVALTSDFYPAFAYSTSTAWTATTTIPLGPAYVAEQWNGVKCFTDTGTLNVSFYDGTNRMNLFSASTSVGTVSLTTNNSFTSSEKRYVDIGTPASSPTKVSCTINKTINP